MQDNNVSTPPRSLPACEDAHGIACGRSESGWKKFLSTVNNIATRSFLPVKTQTATRSTARTGRPSSAPSAFAGTCKVSVPEEPQLFADHVCRLIDITMNSSRACGNTPPVCRRSTSVVNEILQTTVSNIATGQESK